MTGRSEQLDVLWADAEFRSFSADYDCVELRLTEAGGRAVTIVGEGYLGFRRSPAWDEVVVESAEISRETPLIAELSEDLAQSGAARIDSGSPSRNERSWVQLTVRFIDGSDLILVAARFRVAS